MKGLLELFGKKADKKNTTLLSAARMQALGVLQITLDHAMKKPCILTQVSVAVPPLQQNAYGIRCEVLIKANFYWSGKAKEYGREYAAPLPPQVVARIEMSSTGGNVLSWGSAGVRSAKIDNIGTSPWIYEGYVERDVELERKIEKFVVEFSDHRPHGFAIMPTGHDQVIWQINPPDPFDPADHAP